MEDQLIDRPTEQAPKDEILGIIRWWERKRIWFNVLQIVIILFIIFFMETHWALNKMSRPIFYIESGLYFLFINICYCAGWGAHLLMYYYFKSIDKSHILDFLMLLAGSAFTGLVTFVGYNAYL